MFILDAIKRRVINRSDLSNFFLLLDRSVVSTLQQLLPRKSNRPDEYRQSHPRPL